MAGTFELPVHSKKSGTNLIEMEIEHPDTASEISGMQPGGFTPLVFSLPAKTCTNRCIGCGCLTRIPSGFYPIVTKFGRNFPEGEFQPGGNCFMPWTRLSKLVSKQLTTFATPVNNCKTKDNATASLDTLIVFKITSGTDFIEKIGADKLDLMLRAYLDEAVREMASEIELRSLYDLQGSDVNTIKDEMNKMFGTCGVQIISFTLVSARMAQNLVDKMQEAASFITRVRNLEAEQAIRVQGMDNLEEMNKIMEVAKVEKLKVEEAGATEAAKIDIEITGIASQNSKEVAAARAEFEEKVQEMINDGELQVVDFNNQRDSITRQVEGQIANEGNAIRADAWMYARDRDLEKAIAVAANKAKAKEVVAEAEKTAAEVQAARRKHEQDLERLNVFEALARNENVDIVTSGEVAAGRNVKFGEDTLDELVNAGMKYAKAYMDKPLQQPLMAGVQQFSEGTWIDQLQNLNMDNSLQQPLMGGHSGSGSGRKKK